MSSSAAASSRGVVPEPTLVGRAGSAPGTKPSGSDQVPDQKSNGTPGSAVPIALFSAVAVDCVSPAPKGPAAARELPGAFTRSCRTACGKACPANTTSEAPTAAATSVVSAAAAITTQCAAIRRAGSGPRGANTNQRIPYDRKLWQFPSVTNKPLSC